MLTEANGLLEITPLTLGGNNYCKILAPMPQKVMKGGCLEVQLGNY